MSRLYSLGRSNRLLPRSRARSWQVAAVAGISTLIAAGCASSAGSASSSGSARASGSASTLTGAPIKLFTFGAYTLGPGATEPAVIPQTLVGAKAAAAMINAAGGVGGRPIQILSCDTQGTSSGPITCARQAVSDGVTAVVGDDDVAGSSVTPLQAAGIPDIGNEESGLQATSPDSYLLWGGSSSLVVGQVAVEAAKGLSSQSIVINSGPTVSLLSTFLKPVEVRYPKFKITPVVIPTTAVDLSAVVAQAEQSQSISVSPTSQNSLDAFMSAYAQSGVQRPLVSNGYTFSPSTIANLGSKAEGVYVVSGVLPPTYTSDPGVVAFSKWMNTVSSSAPKDASAVIAYDSVILVADMLKGVASPTPAGLTAKLKSATDVRLPMLPPINFTKPSADTPETPRIVNNGIVVDQIRNGQLIAVSGKFVDAYTGQSLVGS